MISPLPSSLFPFIHPNPLFSLPCCFPTNDDIQPFPPSKRLETKIQNPKSTIPESRKLCFFSKALFIPRLFFFRIFFVDGFISFHFSFPCVTHHAPHNVIPFSVFFFPLSVSFFFLFSIFNLYLFIFRIFNYFYLLDSYLDTNTHLPHLPHTPNPSDPPSPFPFPSPIPHPPPLPHPLSTPFTPSPRTTHHTPLTINSSLPPPR